MKKVIGGDEMAVGIILAGGKSSRLGKNKMDLIINTRKIVEHTIYNMSNYVDFVTLVTGHYKTEVDLPNIEIKKTYNQDYEQGMFSSIQCGVKQIQDDVFIIPGDYPMVKGDTYDTILRGSGSLRVPTYKGRRGHPIYISKELLEEIKREPISSNLKVWRDKHIVTYIEVEDRGILLDIDTIEDYQNIVQEMREEPNED